jgi:integrase
LTHAFQKLVVESGVPRVRFHDLRHTGASLMLDQGASVETVRQRLGHTSAKTTLDMYVHGYPDSQKEGATKLGASIAGAIDKLERATG